MVLNKMKRASIKRSIQKLTTNRVLENHNSKIEKVVCLVDIDVFSTVQELDKFAESLGVKPKDFKGNFCVSDEAYVGGGVMINSSFLDGSFYSAYLYGDWASSSNLASLYLIYSS